jgi:hypothetical protein
MNPIPHHGSVGITGAEPPRAACGTRYALSTDAAAWRGLTGAEVVMFLVSVLPRPAESCSAMVHSRWNLYLGGG